MTNVKSSFWAAAHDMKPEPAITLDVSGLEGVHDMGGRTWDVSASTPAVGLNQTLGS